LCDITGNDIAVNDIIHEFLLPVKGKSGKVFIFFGVGIYNDGKTGEPVLRGKICQDV